VCRPVCVAFVPPTFHLRVVHVVVVIPPAFHPQAVARGAGGGWCVVPHPSLPSAWAVSRQFLSFFVLVFRHGPFRVRCRR
jgi:hypothetical protein